jgi:acetyl-CoA synthetase
MQGSTQDAIEALLAEGRQIPPPPDFAAQANAQPGIYEQAERDYLAWWKSWADKLEWMTPPTQILEWNEPFARWFADGELNASVNALDRHVRAGKAAKVAFYYEGEPGDRWTVTYGQLLDEVCRFANGLRKLGLRKGDRVAIYMPMIVELPIAMLACARIGAAHSVIFGGFSPDSIVDRVNDSECVALITADQGWRRGQKVPLKANCDDAIAKGMPSLKHVVVAKRVGDPVTMQAGRDVWWDDVVKGQSTICEPERMNAEDLLYLLYTSGTTAKPKGIKHTTGGYLTGVTATHKLVFDLKEDRDVYWCAADIGWVTGHSYIVYGPLCNGATSVIYEGTPDFPDKDRLWSIIERYKVTILYTAPTAIRTFMKWGTEFVERHDLSSLRLLGSVGEPINPEAWMWYYKHIGGGRCPVVDTWWQTETGAIMITPLPGITTLKPGSATKPFPGILPDIVNEQGETVPIGGGYIVLKRPWPSMLRGIYGDDERYRQTYWSKFPHMYLAGDGCRRDEDGDYWFLGRIDDVMNVSGHRISTTEVESALVDYPDVAEAAVVGRSDDITGQAICAFVSVKSHATGSQELANTLRDHVAEKLGKFCRPKYLTFTQELPKTRSGKIMRRLLRDIAEGRMLGDTTTLADSSIVSELQARAKDEASKED